MLLLLLLPPPLDNSFIIAHTCTCIHAQTHNTMDTLYSSVVLSTARQIPEATKRTATAAVPDVQIPEGQHLNRQRDDVESHVGSAASGQRPTANASGRIQHGPIAWQCIHPGLFLPLLLHFCISSCCQSPPVCTMYAPHAGHPLRYPESHLHAALH
ncbi:hypothetical protein B0J11DRAFT_113719 [Dendryphion nanum]|uniref:Uncharacterized protein n=1 Tax=Dendryphion nanum TaxID=256645 RepID=A0A9P9DAY6_9PLEO|nr:hypothetical protein B0J11DRAFT_113719 [Dendryphion nanum]